jgi:hypothetical protein
MPQVHIRRNYCPVTRKEQVSDRAKRYRANQLGCRPVGPKVCALCGSRSQVMVDHRDGDESNGKRSNLRWICRSCNASQAVKHVREGKGRRTVQYNGRGAGVLAEYLTALAVLHGDSDAMPFAEARQLIHDTPKFRRSEFAREVWQRRREYGTDRIEEVPF